MTASQQEKNSDSNVDENEIAKFESLAARWWDPEGEFRPLHDINPLRLNYINERTELVGTNVLDVGCGGGILSESMAFRGAKVTGIDMGEAPLSVARLHAQQSGLEINYRKSTVETLADEPDKQGSFDVITCLEMLEHVPSPASVVEACARLLKPGGQIFFATINRHPKAWLFAIVGAEYVLKMLPKGTHEFSKFIKPHELSRWMRESQLSVRGLTGMTFNPLTRTYRLEDHKTDVNYLLHGTRSEVE